MFYLLFLLPGMLLMMWAQFHIKSTYAKYARVESSLGMTGAEVAETILREIYWDWSIFRRTVISCCDFTRRIRCL